jgi:hypothetical protein
MHKFRCAFDTFTIAKIHLSALALLTLASRTGLVLAVLLGVTVVAVLTIVVWPAVWAKRKSRRDAALAVLDLILRRR